MKKIDGEIIQQAVEVGAKYIADDGTEFDNKWDCERYEAKIFREKQAEHFNSVYDSIIDSEILEGDHCIRTYIKHFEKKEDFLDTFSTLRKFGFDGVDYHAYLNNKSTIKDENLCSFPATFIIEAEYVDNEDGRDSEFFNFIEANQYIKELQDKIDGVKKFIKDIKSKLPVE